MTTAAATSVTPIGPTSAAATSAAINGEPTICSSGTTLRYTKLTPR